MTTFIHRIAHFVMSLIDPASTPRFLDLSELAVEETDGFLTMSNWKSKFSSPLGVSRRINPRMTSLLQSLKVRTVEHYKKRKGKQHECIMVELVFEGADGQHLTPSERPVVWLRVDRTFAKSPDTEADPKSPETAVAVDNEGPDTGTPPLDSTIPTPEQAQQSTVVPGSAQVYRTTHEATANESTPSFDKVLLASGVAFLPGDRLCFLKHKTPPKKTVLLKRFVIDRRDALDSAVIDNKGNIIKGWSLLDLILLGRAVSQRLPLYQLYKGQCYLYSALFFDTVVHLNRDQGRVVDVSKEAMTCTWSVGKRKVQLRVPDAEMVAGVERIFNQERDEFYRFQREALEELARPERETARANAEKQRADTEAAEKVLADRRAEAEAQRANAEAAEKLEANRRAEAEAQRANVEAQRANVEAQRANVEAQRANVEAAEKLEANHRAEEEARRANTEAQRADAEAQRAKALEQELLALKASLAQRA